MNMKLERMLSIIIYLLNREKVKAKELADRFEVSVRTIYRDIEALSQAGIPVIAYQGVDGGIGIMEGYKLDRNLLTSDEVFRIVAGLKGLYSISEDKKIKLLIEKLTCVAGASDYIPTGNEIMIDLSPWNRNDQLGVRIREIKKAIQERRIIEFMYYSNGRLTERRAEPYIIIFKESNWYLYAWCLLRNDFRLFRLRRMSGLGITETGFEPRDFSMDSVKLNSEFDADKHSTIVVLFDKSMIYSVNDIFGVDNYETDPDGRLKVTFQMKIDGWLYGFLLGFGDKIEVLEPVELRNTIKNMAESISRIYR
ncbi:MAG: YafY family transcriptional regulator [Clostridiaceae bacterium]|nr:YafY family transcriptional regulator [Clostridiaceae bacterium]